MDMLKSRTLTSYTYDEALAKMIAADIVNRYFPEFVTLRTRMDLLREKTP
jgi:hypothetical protein